MSSCIKAFMKKEKENCNKRKQKRNKGRFIFIKGLEGISGAFCKIMFVHFVLFIA